MFVWTEVSEPLSRLLSLYGIAISLVKAGEEIPGSHWGDSEAGLIGNTLYLRTDTPLHSALHEACHFICMDESRRANLHTDAGGSFHEEDAVCYLQILLTDFLPVCTRSELQRDMDDWGYSFRLGSAEAWFTEDADDARSFLLQHGLINADNVVCIGKNRD